MKRKGKERKAMECVNIALHACARNISVITKGKKGKGKERTEKERKGKKR